MRVLAIDTALEACSSAILDVESDTIIASRSLDMARGHAERLVPLIAEVMADAELDFPDIDRIAVTTGPGSFTGLRVGIAAARGIAVTTARPVVGVTTLAALAAPYIAEDASIGITSAIDARHNHVYVQICGPQGRILVSPRIIPAEEAARAAAGTGVPMRLVGSGAAMLAKTWPAAPAPASVDARRAADIAWVARLGAAADEQHAPPKPFYLRAADAQPQDAAQVLRR